MKRLFIGVPITCENAEEIVNDWQTNHAINANLCPSYYGPSPGKRSLVWTKPSNWHITVVFLGAYPESVIYQLIPIINEAFINSGAFSTQLKGVGVFPPTGKPNVLWLGLESVQLLQASYEKLIDLLQMNNFQFDQKPLKPHLTVARIKYLPNRASLNELLDKYRVFNFGNVSIDRVILYESISTINGVIYVPLHENILNMSNQIDV